MRSITYSERFTSGPSSAAALHYRGHAAVWRVVPAPLAIRS
ncbi:MAG: hypothetical protein AAF089_11665 [Bacteroidota bacterium]